MVKDDALVCVALHQKLIYFHDRVTAIIDLHVSAGVSCPKLLLQLQESGRLTLLRRRASA